MSIQETISQAVRVQIEQPPLLETPAPQQHKPSELTPEQLKALETVFAETSSESKLVLGLMGMWTGTLVLHDVLKEATTPSGDEELEELEEKKKKKDDT